MSTPVTVPTPLSVSVLVSLGCYNKISQPEWPISNTNLLLTALEDEALCLGSEFLLLPGEVLENLASHGVLKTEAWILKVSSLTW